VSVSSEDTRKLSYPLLNPLVVAGDTPNDGTPILPFAWSSLDSDEKVDITLHLSLNEYVALASSVDVGRDIAYGVDTNLIWWIWTRALIEGGTMTCEQIIDCITNDADTRQALLDYLTANGFTPNPTSGGVQPQVALTASQQSDSILRSIMFHPMI